MQHSSQVRGLSCSLSLVLIALSLWLAACGTDDSALEDVLSDPPPNEYPHAEAIAETEWLEQHLDDPSVRIVDCRFPQSDSAFRSGHIPGASQLDVLAQLVNPDSDVPYLVPSATQFEELMANLGIGNRTLVVVYDTSGGLWAAKLWWALMYYGHTDVRLLNGGLTKWQNEGRPIQTNVDAPQRTSFVAHIQPQFLATIEDVKEAIDSPEIHLVDALTESHHTGEQPFSPDMQAGHIPSAKNIPAPANLDSNTQTLLPVDVLEEVWAAAEMELDEPVIIYCGAGYYGAFDLFALYLLGYQDIRLYDGSWVEWTSYPDLPIATGA